MLYIERSGKYTHVSHHIDAGDYHGVEVEAHYRPSCLFNPIYNRRLQKWFVTQQDEQFRHEVDLPDNVGRIHVPTYSFNVIFQLSHIYNHVLHEGIGLRQLVDYYFVLRHKAVEKSKMDQLKSTLHFSGDMILII